MRRVKCGVEAGEAEFKISFIIYADNQGYTALTNNLLYHSRTRHVDIQHHFVRGKVEGGETWSTYALGS